MSLIEGLNIPQKEAVLKTDGPLLVLAGAGTGKTKVLTSRIIHIVNSNLASPLQILAVTFTNKAAAEMKKRIGEIIGDHVNNLWIGTFHSIASRILRRHAELVGLRNDFTIIDSDDQLRLLKQIIADFNIDPKQFPAKNYLNKISRLKDQDITSAKFNISSDPSLPKLREVYETYQYRLKSMNAADFGDLLLYNLEIFSKAPEVLSYYQDKFRYILVDEYQDTNNGQYKWLLHLAALHKNICCVGDDDQSIYSWRGANIANILRFEKDFADAQVIRLEQNYRSSGNILKAADSVISNNKERHGKTLWTAEKVGEKVKVISFYDDRTEAQTISLLIRSNFSSGKVKLSNVAILVRAGYQTRSFEEAFMQNSLPYRVIGGLKFYERMEIRDSIAYLRVVANPNDDLALSRIINVPKRGVGDGTINNLYEKSKADQSSLFQTIKNSIEQNELKGKAKDALKFLVDSIDRWNKMLENSKLSDIADVILKESGYVQMWRSENSLEAQGRIENIEEFVRSLDEFSSLVEFLEYVSLVEAKDDKSIQDAVNIMTVHAAKGLEFDLVFIPGLEDGIFPSSRSVEERNGVEEERRLLYVAITRAKKNLYLTYAKTRYVFGDYQNSLPSRFIKELPAEEISFEEVSFGSNYGGGSYGSSHKNSNGNYGYSFSDDEKKSYKPNSKTSFFPAKTSNIQSGNSSIFSAAIQKKSSNIKSENSNLHKRVFHQKFGYGKVVEVDGNKLEIEFEKSGKKTVMKDFVTAA